MRASSEFDGSHLGKYRLIDRIGSGGMAEVYSARHEGESGFTKDLVIKMILPGFADQPKFIEMFLNEAKLAAQLTHPNIVHIFDFGSQNGRHFLVMEFVRGLTLRKICSYSKEAKEPIPVRIAARILCGAAKGLHYAHELTDDQDQPLGIVHRDVSPDNLIVSRDGIPKLLDFGIAKATTAASATTQGNLKGKYPYMSPELVLGEKVDRRMDVYALGVMLYELVTGQKPFSADDTQVLQLLTQITEEDPPPLADSRSDVPDGLQEIVSKAMAKDPASRYQTAREMHVALEGFLSKSGESVLEFHTAEYLNALVEESGGPEVAFGRPFQTPTSDIKEKPKTLGPRFVSSTALVAPRAGSSFPWKLALVTAVAVAAVVVVYVMKKSNKAASAAASAAAAAPIQQPQIGPGPGTQPTPVDPPPKDPPEPEEPELVVGQALDITPVSKTPDAGVPVPDAAGETVAVVQPVSPKEPKEPKEPKISGAASLTVRSSPYCTLYVDNKKVGDTPISALKVKAGKRKLRCVNKEGGQQTASLQLAAGESKSQTFRFNKGKLVIRVKPWGEVWVDGKKRGVTPIGPVTVYEGSHKIKAVNKDLGVTRTVRARVGSGETAQVKIDLTK